MRDTNIFLADADSTDQTVKAAQDSNHGLAVTVIRGGLPSVGRNNGAIRAYTRYILFIDADMELADPTLLRRAVALMNPNPFIVSQRTFYAVMAFGRII